MRMFGLGVQDSRQATIIRIKQISIPSCRSLCWMHLELWPRPHQVREA